MAGRSGGLGRKQGIEFVRLLFGGILRQASMDEPPLGGVKDVELAGDLQALVDFVPLCHLSSPSWAQPVFDEGIRP